MSVFVPLWRVNVLSGITMEETKEKKDKLILRIERANKEIYKLKERIKRAEEKIKAYQEKK